MSTSTALKALFSVDLILRDVSCGDILLLRAPGNPPRGLLVDLEYVKDVTIKTVPHEFRTVSEATLESFEDANENI